MTFDEYQKETRKTDLGTGPEHNLISPDDCPLREYHQVVKLDIGDKT